jgi:release factor glutamine methyltransferase
VVTIGEALRRSRRALSTASDSADSDARRLAAEAVGETVTWVLAHPEANLSDAQVAWLDQALARCARGEPLAYVLGFWEFYGRRFHVSPDVLIPRPETELLVQQVLEYLRSNPAASNVVDVGTGSGCIAVTLAAEVPRLRALAVDISRPALEIGRTNARTHEVAERIRWVQADLLTAFRTECDVVVANLPYIPRPRLAQLEVARHEPLPALDGGEDGLSALRRLVSGLAGVLRPGGFVAMEIDEGQGNVLKSLLASAFPRAEIRIGTDLSGFERFVTLADIGPT